MQEYKTIVIDIKLNKGLAVTLVVVLAVALLAWSTQTAGRVAASAGEAVQAQSTGMRQFYLSTSGAAGIGARGVCGPGYHMASLWEIVDPSNLKYNTTLGWTETDSGQGPPADEIYVHGWVRTGYVADISTTAGRANCLGWTSAGAGHRGTIVSLPASWTSGVEDIGVWHAAVALCSDQNQVWCIED